MLPLLRLRERLADIIFPEGNERRSAAERAANFDDLTGLANRRAFERALPAAEADPTTAIVLFDANNFGLVNKAAGHLAGDALLQQIGTALRRSASRFGFGERVFRIGGDEFAAICPAQIADALRDECETEVGRRRFDGFDVSLSGHAGPNFAEADAGLQARKREAKGE